MMPRWDVHVKYIEIFGSRLSEKATCKEEPVSPGDQQAGGP